jgi:hypothetical protein
LDSRLSQVNLSRSQLDARRLGVAEQRRELERVQQEQEAADRPRAALKEHQPLQPSNRIASAAELTAEAAHLSVEWNRALQELEFTAQQIDSLLTNGQFPTTQTQSGALARRHGAAATDGSDAARQSASRGGYASLPSSSLASDDLAAFDGTVAATVAGVPLTTSSSQQNGVTTSDIHSSSSSPFVLHHPSLLAAYLARDDEWARALNALFRAQFGAPDSSAPSSSATGAAATIPNRLQQTLRALSAEESTQSEMLSVLQATPHAKNLRTPSLARGKIVPRMTAAPGGDVAPAASPSSSSFSTPPPRGSNATSAPSRSSASSLSAEVYESLTSALSSLYHSFPSSQEYWLLSNAQYLSSQARLQAQHAAMVEEDRSRALSQQQLNESIAEASITAKTLQAQLSALLFDLFPALWERLRRLQLLEVLRADLDAKYTRQEEYLAAQQDVLRALLEQKARHALLLGAQRWGLERLGSLKAVMEAAWGDLSAEGVEHERRVEQAYARLERHHAQTKSILGMHAHDPNRLGIDARNELLARTAKITLSGLESLGLPTAPPSKDSSSTSASAGALPSFATLLSSAEALSTVPERLAASSAAADRARETLLDDLETAAARARAALFDDGRDVRLAKDAAAAASEGKEAVDGNQRRLARSAFARAQGEAERAVDAAAAELNANVQQLAQVHAMLAPAAASASGGTVNIEREVRPVWAEFIQAPDLLEQRLRRLQQQLREAEAR